MIKFWPVIYLDSFDNKNDINFRVTVSKKVSNLIANGMNLLGIGVPEKM